MAFPTISINNDQPLEMIGGVASNISMSIQTNTIGKSTLTLSLHVANSCTFLDGSKDMIREIETTAAGEVTEFILGVGINSTLPQILTIRLKAEIVNVDAESDTARLRVRLNNKPEAISNHTNTDENEV